MLDLKKELGCFKYVETFIYGQFQIYYKIRKDGSSV